VRFRQAQQQWRREYFLNLLVATGWQVHKVSDLSGIARQSIYQHMQKLGLYEDYQAFWKGKQKPGLLQNFKKDLTKGINSGNLNVS
jgi:lysine/ornithine N-monooxygenase